MLKMFKQIATANAPRAIGPYSQAISANGFLYTAGQIGFDPKSESVCGLVCSDQLNKAMEIVGPNDVQAQTRQALANLKAIVEEGGSSMDRVIKTTVFLKDMNDFAKMNEIYTQAFGDARPARSAIEVARLPRDALVEIEAVALVKSNL